MGRRKNWTKKVIRNMRPFAEEFNSRETHILEVGVFEGRTAAWFLRSLLGHPRSTWTGVDPWTVHNMGARYTRDAEGWAKIKEVEAKARENVKGFGEEKIKIIKAPSWDVWRSGFVESNAERFDLIYVDGEHLYFTALRDMLLCWPMVKTGGIMLIDDYETRHAKGVRFAADAFEDSLVRQGAAATLFKNKQVGLRKLKKTRTRVGEE